MYSNHHRTSHYGHQEHSGIGRRYWETNQNHNRRHINDGIAFPGSGHPYNAPYIPTAQTRFHEYIQQEQSMNETIGAYHRNMTLEPQREGNFPSNRVSAGPGDSIYAHSYGTQRGEVSRRFSYLSGQRAYPERSETTNFGPKGTGAHVLGQQDQVTGADFCVLTPRTAGNQSYRQKGQDHQNDFLPLCRDCSSRSSSGLSSHKQGGDPALQPRNANGPHDRGQGYSPDHENISFSPTPLGLPSDKKYLTEFHCFMRRHCIEVFCASAEDMSAPRRGRKKPVKLGQVGIRCLPCSRSTSKRNGAVYYPTGVQSIYNSVMLIQQRHFNECPAVTFDLREEYKRLKQVLGRSGAAKDYWASAAKRMGLVDTPDGIRFKPRAPGYKQEDQSLEAKPNTDPQFEGSLVYPKDKQFATEYAFLLMSQMKACTFAESDRLGKRRAHRIGFPGIACKHCFGSNGSGRYFPSSIKTFADVSKTLNVLNQHLVRCKGVPPVLQKKLESLRQGHQSEKDTMAFGSQKIFFDLVWARLHHTQEKSENDVASVERDASSKSGTALGTRGGLFVQAQSAPYCGDQTLNDVAQVMTTTLCRSPIIWAKPAAKSAFGKPVPKKAAPKDNVPVLKNWSQNRDGSIAGIVSNSKRRRI